MKKLRGFRDFFTNEHDKYAISLIDKIVDNFDPEYLKIQYGYVNADCYCNNGTLYSYDIVDGNPDNDINLSLIMTNNFEDSKYLRVIGSEGTNYHSCPESQLDRLLTLFTKKTNL